MSTHVKASERKKAYLLTKLVVELICENGGYIYGGAVRDMILHDYHAYKFYDANFKNLKKSRELLEQKKNSHFEMYKSETTEEKEEAINEEIDHVDENESDENDENGSYDNDNSSENSQESFSADSVESESADIDQIVADEILRDNKKKMEDLAQIHVLYQDPSYMPEYSDRFLVPTDIDCSIIDIERFRKQLEENSLSLTLIQETKLKFYNKDNLDNSCKEYDLRKYIIRLNINERTKQILKIKDNIIIKIDSVTTPSTYDSKDPPFGLIDFECNTLILSSSHDYIISPGYAFDGCKNPNRRSEKLHEIMENIKKKVAIVVDRVPKHRMLKMKEKNWKIIAYVEYITYTLHNSKEMLLPDEEANNCSLCLEYFEELEYKLKRSCCKSAIFHPKCFKEMLEAQQQFKSCPLCRDGFVHLETSLHKTVHF